MIQSPFILFRNRMNISMQINFVVVLRLVFLLSRILFYCLHLNFYIVHNIFRCDWTAIKCKQLNKLQ